MATIKESYLIKKRNILNEIRANNMTLQELRFFSIYLSKINPADLSTRIVRFPMSDFQKMMELGRIDISYMKNVTNSLLSKIVNVPNERGGYEGFQLFKGCVVDINNKNEWYVEIDAHNKALPLMFEFKDRYFSYQLWNALRLKSSNQLRMYEILKQYEKTGERTISIEELKGLLGIGKEEYPRFNDFKKWVLGACQQALIENTDIKFTYEPHGKMGKGGKVLNLKFKIEKNTNYIDQLTLFDFIQQQPVAQADSVDYSDSVENPIYADMIKIISDACMGEFSSAELDLIFSILKENLPFEVFNDDIKFLDYVCKKHNELQLQSQKTKIRNRFNYFKTILTRDTH